MSGRLAFILFWFGLLATGAPAGETPTASFPPDLTEIHARGRRALVEIEYHGSGGGESWLNRQLGVLVGQSGLVLTSGALRAPGVRVDSVGVRFPGRTELAPATFLGKDEDTDLAFLKLAEPAPAPAQGLDFSPAGELCPAGTPVAMVGLLPESYRNSAFVRSGYIMATLTEPLPQYVLDVPDDAQNDCAPIFSRDGTVLGVLLPGEGAGIGQRDGGPGTYLAYPAKLVARLASAPPVEKEEREKQHGWLGVLMGALPSELAQHWKLPTSGGVVVSQIFADSPAAAAGMREGDVIVEFAGRPVNCSREDELQLFVRLVKNSPAGKPAAVKVLRPEGSAEGQPVFRPQELAITLGQRPPSSLYEEVYDDAPAGLSLKELSVDDRVALNLDAEVGGVLVTRVEEGSWAELAEFEPGDIIARVNGHETKSLEEYTKISREELTRRPPAILFFVHREGGTVFLVMKPRFEQG